MLCCFSADSNNNIIIIIHGNYVYCSDATLPPQSLMRVEM